MKNPRIRFSVLLTVGLLLLGLGAQAQETPVPGVSISFGTDIDRDSRQLVGKATTFAAGIEKITCLTVVKGLEAPTSVTHVWYRDGKTMARVDLNIGSSNWRTWSSKRLLPDWTGHWEVKILDSDNRVLGSADFTIE
jgi:Protein of unknown function (DUF2914)